MYPFGQQFDPLHHDKNLFRSPVIVRGCNLVCVGPTSAFGGDSKSRNETTASKNDILEVTAEIVCYVAAHIYVAASSVPQWSAVDDNFRVDKFYWYCRRLLPDGDAYTKETLDWIRRKMVDLKKTAKRKRRSLPDDDDEDPIALIHRQRTAAAALQQRTPERRREPLQEKRLNSDRSPTPISPHQSTPATTPVPSPKAGAPKTTPERMEGENYRSPSPEESSDIGPEATRMLRDGLIGLGQRLHEMQPDTSDRYANLLQHALSSEWSDALDLLKELGAIEEEGDEFRAQCKKLAGLIRHYCVDGDNDDDDEDTLQHPFASAKRAKTNSSAQRKAPRPKAKVRERPTPRRTQPRRGATQTPR